MQRYQFKTHIDQLSLSYLDSGGNAPILVALHAHMMEGLTFAHLADSLSLQWRVIALDQRGHGNSDHATTYTRSDYLNDLSDLLTHLHVKEPVVLLGNSLGGINSYQFAAKHSDRVRAMIIEDIGVEIRDDFSFCLAWSGVFKTKTHLEQRIEPHFLPYLRDSFRQTTEGWRLSFDPQDMMKSVSFVRGDHWKDWLATDCPVLLIRGQDSNVTTEKHLEQMAARRPNTTFKILHGGHIVHFDNPKDYTEAVKKFLQDVQ